MGEPRLRAERAAWVRMAFRMASLGPAMHGSRSKLAGGSGRQVEGEGGGAHKDGLGEYLEGLTPSFSLPSLLPPSAHSFSFTNSNGA